MSKIIRRRKAARARALAARAQWVVRYRFAGRTVHGGTFECPHEARAEARELRRDLRVPAWVSHV